MTFRQRLQKIKIVGLIASIRLTVLCLFLLYMLTFVGTLAQIQTGIYEAQTIYFHSFFFLAFGFFPFPGGQLVMWVLFVNLLAVVLTRFVFSLKNFGILVIHMGLFLFLISGYITMRGSQESFLSLKEGQASNVSTAYHDWEISVWEEGSLSSSERVDRRVSAIDSGQLKPGQSINFNDLDLRVTVEAYYRNCRAYGSSSQMGTPPLSASGIVRLEKADLFKEPEKNTPGGIFELSASGQPPVKVLLFGEDTKPYTLVIAGKTYQMSLRLKRFPLPFTLRLIDFKKEDHPGTDMARAFQSLVEINVDNLKREKLISMNDPLRYKDFTFYQSSFAQDKKGTETSVLAVVNNKGRVMPYIATGVTFFGLVIHFILAAMRSRTRKYA